MKHFYIYGHYTKDTDELFYIGKGYGYRATQLSPKRRNKLWNNIANKHGVVVKILHENLTEEEAFTIERELIKRYGRRDIETGALANMTDGGEGASGIRRPGRKISEKEKRHLSSVLKGKKKPPRTEQHSQKLSESKMGIKLGNFTEEHRRKISESNKGRKFSEEHRNKLRLAKLGKKRYPHSEETKQKMRESKLKKVKL